MAWNTTSAVISFIMLEGARSSSAFFSNSTLPLDASIRIAVGASPSNPFSSFLAPCTLLLAANTIPPQPTASASTAAIRPRKVRPAAAPDMRGCGRTSAPADTGAYSIFDTVGDMVALVAALGEKQAVIIGHDWGAPVAWHAAMFRPEIFTRVAGLSVPPPLRGRGR